MGYDMGRMTLPELEDALTVMAAIQLKQSEVQKLQAAEVDAVRQMLQMVREGAEIHERQMREHGQRMTSLDERIDKLVSGFGAFIRDNRA